MARPNQDKIRVNITLDKELNKILEKRNINKSALISSLLWRFLGTENNKSLISNPHSPIPKNKHQRGLEPPTCGLQDIKTIKIIILSLFILNFLKSIVMIFLIV